MLVSKRRYDTMEGPASPTAVSQYTSPTFNRFQSNSFGEMNSNINNSSPLFRSALQQQQQQQQPYQQQQQQQQHLLSPVQSFHTPKKTRAEEMESGPVSPHFAALQIVARRRNYESAFQSSSSQGKRDNEKKDMNYFFDTSIDGSFGMM